MQLFPLQIVAGIGADARHRGREGGREGGSGQGVGGSQGGVGGELGGEGAHAEEVAHGVLGQRRAHEGTLLNPTTRVAMDERGWYSECANAGCRGRRPPRPPSWRATQQDGVARNADEVALRAEGQRQVANVPGAAQAAAVGHAQDREMDTLHAPSHARGSTSSSWPCAGQRQGYDSCPQSRAR